MLKKIEIKNVALIDYCAVEFGAGLNVLSGETGSGKSIVIDSLNFVLGARADKTLIKNGCDTANVVAYFDEHKLERSMSLDGKNTCFVDGKKVVLSELKEISTKLMDIHGQHEHQKLLNEKSHCEILDLFAGDSVVKHKDELEKICDEIANIKKRIKTIGGSKEEREQMADFLSFQVAEIERTGIKEGEFEELCEKREVLLNKQKIAESLANSKVLLSGDEGSFGVLKSLQEIKHQLGMVAKFSQNFEQLAHRIDSSYLELCDIENELDNAFGNDNDVESFDEVDSRVDLIKRLFKKYGGDFVAMQDFLADAKQKLCDLNSSEELLEKLNAQIDVFKQKGLECAQKLSVIRQKCAKEFEDSVLFELKSLGMENSKLVVSFAQKDEFDKNGIDDVVFLFSANLGENVKPLSKIISGGELSRLSLAIKVLTAKKDQIASMVFDEIDTGISGNIAGVIAQKMAIIAKDKQVLVVSHLPQISAIASQNFVASKEVVGGKTITKVKKLGFEEKIEEVARLIGSKSASTFAFDHAKEMIENGEKFKKSIE